MASWPTWAGSGRSRALHSSRAAWCAPPETANQLIAPGCFLRVSFGVRLTFEFRVVVRRPATARWPVLEARMPTTRPYQSAVRSIAPAHPNREPMTGTQTKHITHPLGRIPSKLSC